MDRDTTTRSFEAALAAGGADHVSLRLFVAGGTPRSLRATDRIRRFCERYLRGRHSLEVIDIYRQPELAIAQEILAAPTLVKDAPGPRRRLVGDFADDDRVRAALGLASPEPA